MIKNTANMQAIQTIADMKLCILRCPKCGRRHGGKIADTSVVTWRCHTCRRYIYGGVVSGKFSMDCASGNELNDAKLDELLGKRIEILEREHEHLTKSV